MTALTFHQALKYRADQARDARGRFAHEGGHGRPPKAPKAPKAKAPKAPPSSSSVKAFTNHFADAMRRIRDARAAAEAVVDREHNNRGRTRDSMSNARSAAMKQYVRSANAIRDEVSAFIDGLSKASVDDVKTIARAVNARWDFRSRKAGLQSLRSRIREYVFDQSRLLGAHRVTPW